MIKRIKERSKCEDRIDDSIDTLRLRYEGYLKETKPMLKELSKFSNVIEINGDDSIANVHRNLLKRLKYLL
jgi:adenylate kinase family enzyme